MEERTNNDAAMLTSKQVTKEESNALVNEHAGTGHPVPVRKQIQRKRLVGGKRETITSNVGNKAKCQRKDKGNDVAMSTSKQVTEEESNAPVNEDALGAMKPSSDTSKQAMEEKSNALENEDDVVVEKPSGETSMLKTDAGTGPPVQVGKKKQKRRLVKGMRVIEDGQKNVGEEPSSETSKQVKKDESSALLNEDAVAIEKPSGETFVQANDAGTGHPVQDDQKNVEKASTSNVGNKAEAQIEDDQNNVEKASSIVVNTDKGPEITHPVQVRSQNKRKIIGNDKRGSEDGKQNVENLPSTYKGKRQDEMIIGKRGDEKKNDETSRIELSGVKKHNMHQNVVGGDKKRNEKRSRDQLGGDVNKKDKRPRNELGGVIFMCNAKTKPDCFHFRVLGVSPNKKEVVLSIKPGLKLFLYDFDLKVMYGVFKASSAGGMKLEPAAFGGAFPAQVRFDIEKDCLPLPESVFKKAMKDSYDVRTRKFQTELTPKQANQLAQLFREQVPLRPLSRPEVIPYRPVSRQETTLPSGPFFINEKEYRNYGLQQGRSPAASVDFSTRPDREREQLQRHLASVNLYDASPRREMVYPDQRVLDESNPYDSNTDSLVNRYLTMPRMTGPDAGSYSAVRREAYVNFPRGQPEHVISNSGERIIRNTGALHSLYDSRAPPPAVPDSNRRYQRLGQDPALAPSTVTSRYSFAGPSLRRY